MTGQVSLPGAPAIARYRAPSGVGRAELEEKRSRFIGTAGPAPDLAAAQAFIAALRAEHPDATHHAWAYRLEPGPQGGIGSSDDGEPGGTAGRPMLQVLEGSGLAQAVVVGTRYFGGIKLGMGGLVRAYSAAAREALARTPFEERAWHALARVTVDYATLGGLHHALSHLGAQVRAEIFADQVTLELAVPRDGIELLAAALRDLTSGRVALEECWVSGAGVWLRPGVPRGGAR